MRTYSIIDTSVHNVVVPPGHSRITLNDRNKGRGNKKGTPATKIQAAAVADDDDDDDDEYFNRSKKLDFENLAHLLIKAAATSHLIAEGMGFVGVTRVFVKEMGHMNAMDRRLAVLNEPHRIRIQAFCRMVTERCRCCTTSMSPVPTPNSAVRPVCCLFIRPVHRTSATTGTQ